MFFKILSSQVLLIVVVIGSMLSLALLLDVAPRSPDPAGDPVVYGGADQQAPSDALPLTEDIPVLKPEPVILPLVQVNPPIVPAGLPAVQVSPDLSAVPMGGPVRLRIPAIGANALVKRVGLTPDGAMDVPKDPADTAWFNLGPRPGERGSAVISGHYGWKNNIPAVFDNLYQLQKGDKIYVENDKGIIVTFVVRESRRYDENADASDVFGSNDGKSHLNLITCEGVWNKDVKSYSKRLVVFADKEGE